MSDGKPKIWFRPNAAPGRRWEVELGDGRVVWADGYHEANELVRGMKRRGGVLAVHGSDTRQ